MAAGDRQCWLSAVTLPCTCSVLKFSPNLISLPGDGSGAALSASASEAAIAGAGDDAEGAAGAGAADGAPSVGHRSALALLDADLEANRTIQQMY